MLNRLYRLWRPGMYQGKARMRGYFEGWYYKMVDAAEKNVVAVIPGVSFDESGNAGAFIQLLDAAASSSAYFKYDIEQFKTADKQFELQIGPNRFSSTGIAVDAAGDGHTVKGMLTFTGLSPWPVKLFLPGAMGWYAFVPFMECYHAVLSFDHIIEGVLDLDGRRIDFSGGRGYMEKDWGTSFPRYHIWLQTNHFLQSGMSLMISIANIPWRGSYFDGFIAGLRHGNELYRFTTYTGARLSLFKLEERTLSVHIASKRHRLEIEIYEAEGIPLRAPVIGAMRGTLRESQTAVTRVRLVDVGRKRENLLYEGEGRHTGFEMAGSREELAAIKAA